jgi:hypothetical protein
MFAFFKPATVASRAKKFFNYFKVKWWSNAKKLCKDL